MTTPINSNEEDRGKIFEAKISQAFRDLESIHPVSFKRLVDTRTAGNYVESQESDFELIVRGPQFGAPYHFMLEAKSSDKFDTFASCFRQFVKTKQRAKMMLRERAGCKGLYMFYSSKTDEIELWHGKHINDAWPEKRKPIPNVPIMCIALKNLPDFALYFIKHPSEFAPQAL